MPTRPSLSDGSTTVTFLKCSGQLQPFAKSSADLTRPGVDGVAFRLEGKRSEASKFDAMRDTTNTAAESLKQSVADFKGQLVTFIDDFGVTVEKVFVKDVKLVMEKAIGGATGGIIVPPVDAQRLLGWEIYLQRTTLPA